MNKKFIIVLIVLLVLVGGWLWWQYGGLSESVTVKETTEEVVVGDLEDVDIEEILVTYTDTGFSPNPFKVKAGDTVVFVNDSSKEMWVASAVHPTHEVLPGFDQLEDGDEYEYTFNQAGEWKYHNHLVPSDRGSVVVE